MIDLIYVLGTIAFFALMLAYVRGCELLGRTASTDVERIRGGHAMTIESWIAGVLAVAILVYLVYTLLRPEKF